MNWIALVFALEVGFMPMHTWYEYPSSQGQDFAESYYTTMETEAQLLDNHLFVGGWVTTYMLPDDNGFDNLAMSYEFNAGVRIDMLEVGFRHVCGPHPVMSYPQFGMREDTGAFEGAYEQVYLRFEGTVE